MRSLKRVFPFAGAYTAWVMGSGFATGQELLQFFSSYGLWSYAVFALVFAGFLAVGSAMTEAGYLSRSDPDFNVYTAFCGKTVGGFYRKLMPVCLIAGLVILISGAGSTLQQAAGLPQAAGAGLMAALAFAAYLLGFRRFVRIVSCIGPVIILFTLAVGILTVARGTGGASSVGSAASLLQGGHPAPFWWLAGILYISYNFYGGGQYYSELGTEAGSKQEVRAGAVLGTVMLMFSIGLMNTAILLHAGEVADTAIPTLYLAASLAPFLGGVFTVVLMCSIFSCCSAMLWTITENFVPQGSRWSVPIAGAVAAGVFLFGLLPFGDLIRVVYAISGYIGLLFTAAAIRWRLTHLN